MKNKPTQRFLKLLFGIALGGMILVVGLGIGSSSAARAQEAWTETPTETPAPAETLVITPTPLITDNYSINALSLKDGTVIEEMIIHGPPVPPPGYEIQRKSVSVQDILNAAGTNILTVPAYPWVYGCSAVSGAMIAGYYDRNGYPNLYTGPTDGGVMPLVDDSSWGSWVDVPASPSGNFPYYNNPLVASKLGLDGWEIRGSIDDYWVQYNSSSPDPYIPGSWTQHPWGDAIGDYMQTSQSAYGLGDAYTRFYDNWSNPAAPLTCAWIEAAGHVDGTVGRKQFYQAKGYAVTDCYNQFTDNQYAGGFSFVQYKAEIDAGRPVMINLTGHTIVGVGYADPNTVYIHDTWDNQTHSMTWGGSYSGMVMVAVSIVNLAPANYSIMNVTKAGTGSGTVTSSPPGIDCGTACTYAYDKTISVTLTAAASPNSIFIGWSGGGCTGTSACTVPMSSAQYVTATFTFSLTDLTITKLTILPSAPSTTDNINISVDVANLGGNSTTFRIEFYVDDVWKSCWYLGNPPEYFARVAILAGNSSGTWLVTIPAGTLSAGTHTISAYVDMGCEVVEGNEANNIAGPISLTINNPWYGAAVISSDRNVVAVGRPQIGAQVMTYDGFTGGSTTMYLPMLFKNIWGYDSAFYVQNLDPVNPAAITLKFYDTDGNLSCTQTDSIPLLSSHGTWVPDLTCLPASWVGGVVVTSDRNIVAVGRPHIGNEITTYNGFSSGSLTMYVPMLFKNMWGYDAALYVQNVDAANTADITLKFYDTSGNLTCTQTDSIPSLSSHGYWLPDQTCLGTAWVGGVVVTSNRNIVAVGRPHLGAAVTTYDGFAGGSTNSYIPSLFKISSGYDSALYIQNVDPANAANVTLKFYNANGTLSCTQTDSIPRLSSHGYWLPDLTCLGASWQGSVKVVSSMPVVAVGRLHNGGDVASYDGFMNGNTQVVAPMLFKNMWSIYNSTLTVQNVDPVNAANIMIDFYDVYGNLTCKQTDSIPAMGILNYWLLDLTCLH